MFSEPSPPVGGLDSYIIRATYLVVVRRSTVLIGCGAIAATMAATFQFAGGLGGDAPVSGSTDRPVLSTPRTEQATTESVSTSESAPAALPESLTDLPSESVVDDVQSSAVLVLLDSLVVADPVPNRPPYDREGYQPDGWADLDGDCMSARHEVLAALSEIPAQLSPSGCFVEVGAWTDPYTGVEVREATEITIDHVVPLSEADRSGGWRWDAATRIAFANDETPGVLLPVIGAINQEKGDKRPDEWLPPAAEYHCTYASNWVETKARWRLSATASEVATLRDILSGCDSSALPVPTDAPLPLVELAPASTALPQPATDLDVSEVVVERCQRREERVTLRNPTSQRLSLTGYTLHDEESRHATRLDQFGSLAAGASLVILTGDDATASPGEVVWKRQNVWNNDGDTAFVLTPSGSVSDAKC